MTLNTRLHQAQVELVAERRVSNLMMLERLSTEKLMETPSMERPAMLVTDLFTATTILTATLRKWREENSLTNLSVVEILSISAGTSIGQTTQDSIMATQ